MNREILHLGRFPTPVEHIAKLIYDYTASQGFPVVQVQLWETDDSHAIYKG